MARGQARLQIRAHYGRRTSCPNEEAGVARSYFTRVFKLSFPAPDAVKAIIKGNYPPHLNAQRLMVTTKLAPVWADQMNQLGIR